jgi:hypothetical protein
MPYVEIISGNHTPVGHAYVVVDRFGLLVDLSGVDGQLYDAPTVSRVVWGARDQQGKPYGVVHLRNGQRRTYWDQLLMAPYVNAFAAEYAARGHGDSSDLETRQRPTQNL